MTSTTRPNADAAQRMSLEEFGHEVRAFLEGVAAPRQRVTERWGEGEDRFTLFRGTTAQDVDLACDWQRLVFDAGFGWLCGPTEYGGRDLPAAYERSYYAIEREFETPSRSPLGVSLGMVGPTLNELGTDEAKRRWLRAIYRGDAVGCQLFSEPAAGSDLAAVATRADYDGTAWVVTGQKVWTSAAHYSHVGLLLARTALGPRHRNLTAFLVDMRAPGVEVRPLRQMTGGADFNEVFLDGVVISDAYRLGETNEGWQAALTTLMYERGAIGGSHVGGSGLLDTRRIAEMLVTLGVTGDPAIRQAYGRLSAGISAAKAMRQRAEANARAGRRPGPEMSLSKLALVKNLQALSELVSKALGPRLLMDSGQWGTYSWSEYILSVPGLRIGGGTDEIQRNIIAERVLGLPKEPMPAPAKAESVS